VPRRLDPYREFGDWLRSTRDAIGMSQRDLSVKMGDLYLSSGRSRPLNDASTSSSLLFALTLRFSRRALASPPLPSAHPLPSSHPRTAEDVSVFRMNIGKTKASDSLSAARRQAAIAV
jgi:hypothetical protein